MSDLGIAQTFRNEAEHLSLPCRQRQSTYRRGRCFLRCRDSKKPAWQAQYRARVPRSRLSSCRNGAWWAALLCSA